MTEKQGQMHVHLLSSRMVVCEQSSVIANMVMLTSTNFRHLSQDLKTHLSSCAAASDAGSEIAWRTQGWIVQSRSLSTRPHTSAASARTLS